MCLLFFPFFSLWLAIRLFLSSCVFVPKAPASKEKKDATDKRPHTKALCTKKSQRIFVEGKRHKKEGPPFRAHTLGTR